MKKIKVMLTALIIVAAVGGIFAFQAHRMTKGLKCGDSLTNCPNPTDNYSIAEGPAHFDETYCTTPQGDIHNCTYVTSE